MLTLFLTNSQQQADDQLTPQPKTDPTEALSTQQLDSQILSRLRETGRFDWKQASEHVVWSALTRSDYVLSVGYKPTGFAGELPPDAASSADWQAARAQLMELIIAEERKANPDLTQTQIVAFEENVLPVLDVTVRELSTIQKLRASGLVRYAEPVGYEPNRRQANYK